MPYRRPYSPSSSRWVPHTLTIDPTSTFTAFRISVLVGTRRFAHASLLRGDRALHALLGLQRFPTDDTIRNLFRRFGMEEVQRLFERPSGFFVDKLLSFLEQRLLPYIVVAQLTPRVKHAAQRVEQWTILDDEYAVGEFRLQSVLRRIHHWGAQKRRAHEVKAVTNDNIA